MSSPSWTRYFLSALLLTLTLFTACGGAGGGGKVVISPDNPPQSAQWTWASGSSSAEASGVYGTVGIAAANNVPGARRLATGWKDSSGNLWLFGGYLYSNNSLNDLWQFNLTTKTWTWVSGNSTQNASGVYGAQGVPAATNVPGARGAAVSWTDQNGHLWLFGGSGYDSTGAQGDLNDLWEFDPSTKIWTWIAGSNAIDADGIYGTKGTGGIGNTPGARDGSVGWTDQAGHFWLFAGERPGFGLLNDLWEFDPTNKTWTWVSGSSSANATGMYGTLGVSAGANVPGARFVASAWTDSTGNLWLFGGSGYASTGSGYLNDLWKFSTTSKNWTWMSGSNNADATSSYGTIGVAGASNVPGARSGSAAWRDGGGNLWLIGGGTIRASVTNNFNDLWMFNPTTSSWTWMGGSNSSNATGIYGAMGVAGKNNVPGARSLAVTWVDNSGGVWMFGGVGQASTLSGSPRLLNDLWLYK